MFGILILYIYKALLVGTVYKKIKLGRFHQSVKCILIPEENHLEVFL